MKCHACDVHTDEDRCFICGQTLDDQRSYWATASVFQWRARDVQPDSLTL
jgi:hypothetical protein